MTISHHYLTRIKAHLPGVDPARLRVNPDGLANDVIIADERWVFRFAKDAHSRQHLARERTILDLIRPRLSVPVPDFTVLGDDGVVYPLIEGAPLYRHDLLRLDEATQNAFAGQLATFLRTLHAVPAAELAGHGLGESLPGATREEWLGRSEQAEQQLAPYLWADQKAWIADLFAPLRDGRLTIEFAPVLIHNDLASYHILMAPHILPPRIAGVIDFGVAGAGDPAADFATLITTYGESFVRRMAPWYPGLDDLLDRARLRAGYLDLEWALKGLASNDPSWFMVHIGRAAMCCQFAGDVTAAPHLRSLPN